MIARVRAWPGESPCTKLLACVLAVFALGACSRTAYRPVYRTFDEEGQAVQTKRRAQFETYDYLHHWTREAYLTPERPFTVLVSVDDEDYAVRFDRTKTDVRPAPEHASRFSLAQQDLVVAHGVPDYVRLPFRTTYGEQAVEWLFLKANLLAQFVDGELVYSGPITDKEKVLLRRGYPNYQLRVRAEGGPFRETLIYRNHAGTEMGQYDLADDMMMMQAE